ncbi:MAG: GNAT family N-acetyltransferase [Anaerolineae bacterium]|nr:GNAT family N-acetyltransferase [Anaerolineae bacterium]
MTGHKPFLPDEKVMVRPVESRDVTDLQTHCFVRDTVEATEQRITAYLDQSAANEGIALVVEVDGHAVAISSFRRESHPLFVHRATVSDVVVGIDFQKRGFSRLLNEALRSHAAEMGIEILMTSCRSGVEAEQVYPKLGFIEWGRLPNGIKEPWNNTAYDEVCFYMPVKSQD